MIRILDENNPEDKDYIREQLEGDDGCLGDDVVDDEEIEMNK
jgi:hypothetical protein